MRFFPLMMVLLLLICITLIGLNLLYWNKNVELLKANPCEVCESTGRFCSEPVQVTPKREVYINLDELNLAEPHIYVREGENFSLVTGVKA